MNEHEISRNAARRLAILRHAEGRPLPEILEEVARLGAQLLMQAALEAEVTEFPGRSRYQRAAAGEDARPGSRKRVHREVAVKTTAGPLALARTTSRRERVRRGGD